MQLDDALREYLATNPRITSHQTGRRYWTMLNNFGRYLERPPTAADLTPANYGRWINQRRASGEVAAGTIRGEAEKLLVLWRWVASQRGEPAPLVALPPRSDTMPTALTPGELQRLERAALACEWRVGPLLGSVYWPAMIGVAIDTGERINAITQLRADDFDLAAKRVTFRAETRKGKRQTMVKPLHRRTAHHVALLLAARPHDPFAPVKAESLYAPFRRLLADAGLPRQRSRMFHCLRRTHATMVHRQGGDATASLGHSSDAVTRRSYLDRRLLDQVLPRRRPWWLGWFRRAG